MSKNYAPLFFLIIISSMLFATVLFVRKDIATFANSGGETVGISKNSTTSELNYNVVESIENTNNTEAKDYDTEEQVKESEELEVLSFHLVSEDYFDDALFIGDSRTVGLKKYAMLGNASFYSETGMSIYNIFEKKIQEDTISEEKQSLEEVLTQNSFKKIYLMVGINELGRGTADSYFEEYKKVLLRIQELQPNAFLFVEGNMNVTKEKSDSDPIFNNTNITERNQKIASLEDKKTIFYIDINEVITDEEGYLIANYTFDNIHLKAKYYTIWKDFLLEHGIEE